MQLKGRVALVTGASQGLGKEIARAYLRAGASVTILARDAKMLEQAATELRAEMRDAPVLSFAADVTDETAIAEVVAETQRTFGLLDCLVNNAGIHGPKGALEEIDLREWWRAIEINLMGTVIPMHSVLPGMKRAKYGKIINLSGGGATSPMPQITAYAASKAAVVRLTESVALEVHGFGIDINAVAPGALNTRLLDQVLAAGPDKVGAQFYQRSIEQKERGGASLENAAALCVYLASAASDGVTGRLVSAVWDDWQTLGERRTALSSTDIYTLRRITSKDRNFGWDK